MTIYIHIPFCIKKCNYCDFYSISTKDTSLIKKYIDAVKKEIVLQAENLKKNNKNQSISSIFIGGGTPTSISLTYIKSILETINQNFIIDKDCEITIEANPGTDIDFYELRNISINRISIGIQSFNDEELLLLGRIHNGNTAFETLKTAKKYFNNINADLIFSIPNQTSSSLALTINKLLECDIQHISAYSLIYEPNTKLYNKLQQKEIIPKNDNEDADFYKYIYTTLKNNNYIHYEISNFAKEGFQCRHNLNYWQHNEYIGIGSAAYGYINNKRYYNFYDINKYCDLLDKDKMPIENIEILSKENLFTETIFLGLRSEGISLSLLTEDNIRYCKYLEKENLGYFYKKNNNTIFRLTSAGYFICDEITLKLL